MQFDQALRKAYRGKQVLITGGAGFIGSNLARALVELGAKVSVVDAFIPEYGGNPRNLRGLSGKVAVHKVEIRSHAKRPLGWRPRVGLTQALTTTPEYVKKERTHYL